jgi:nicotinate phosphoribosyltransferase
MAVADVLGLDEDAANPDRLERGARYAFWHPGADYRHFYHEITGSAEPLLRLRLDQGRLTEPHPPLETIRSRVRSDLDSFDQSYQRILNPHVYKVSVTERLRNLKLELIKNYLKDL